MNRIWITLSILSLAVSCSSDDIIVKVKPEVINADYFGNGAEWDPYDEASAWGSEISLSDWDKLFKRLDYMRPGYVRCMINSPFLYWNAEKQVYERERNSGNIRKLLGYCQDKGIAVVYGEYNPPAWEMKDSRMWVEMSVNYLNWLVNGLGFDCIRHFVIFNEPDGNWASTNGDYDLWLSMLSRFDAEMAKYPGLKEKVSFAGPDAVINYRNPESEYDTGGWIARSAADAGDIIGIYDVHAYPGQHEVRSGKYAGTLKELKAFVPEGKKLILGEGGYKYGNPEDSALMAEYRRRVDGHPFTKGSDCNMLVYDYFYGLDMPLLAMEVMNSGLSGIAVWMLDDAMHSNGDSGRTEDVKIWGMWNILGEEVFNDPSQEDLRPWFYTWSLICRYYPSGCDILACEYDAAPGIRVCAAVKDGKITVSAVNCSESSMTLTVELPYAMSDAEMYLYQDGRLSVDGEGFPVPEAVGLKGRNMSLNLPAESFVLLTDMK